MIGATDLDDNPRIIGEVVDMGAYEFNGQTCPIIDSIFPTNGFATTNETVEMQIVASCPAGISQVTVNGNAAQDSGNNAWSYSASLSVGTNTFTVRAMDDAGCTATDTVQYIRLTIPAGLLLWNKLGSVEEITHSTVGPNGVFDGGGFTNGVYGNAFIVDYNQAGLVRFPKEVIPAYRGTIELWAKFIDFPTTINWGANPALFYMTDTTTGQRWQLHLNGNNGRGGGGLCGTVKESVFAATDVYGSWTYQQALAGGDVNAWHHYALIWDKDGIPGVGDGSKKVAVFLDGVMNSGHWATPFDNDLSAPASGELSLLYNDYLTQGRVAFDNIKIWNYAKTNCFNEGESISISITPASGYTTTNETVQIQIVAHSSAGMAQVAVNGNAAQFLGNNEWSYVASLNWGTNVFTILATDTASYTATGRIQYIRYARSGTWTMTGSMNTTRYGHTATLLPNGQVLVVGGDGDGGPMATAELYDPATGTWTVTGPMHTARYGSHGNITAQRAGASRGGWGTNQLSCQRGVVRPGHGDLDGDRPDAHRALWSYGDIAAQWAGAGRGGWRYQSLSCQRGVVRPGHRDLDGDRPDEHRALGSHGNITAQRAGAGRGGMGW